MSECHTMSRWGYLKWRIKWLLWRRWVNIISELRSNYYYNQLGYTFDDEHHVWVDETGGWHNIIPEGKANWYGNPHRKEDG